MAFSYKKLLEQIKLSPHSFQLSWYRDKLTDEEYAELDREMFLARIAVNPSSGIHEYVGVQPMYPPTGEIFKMKLYRP